jgi:hypothetical protein
MTNSELAPSHQGNSPASNLRWNLALWIPIVVYILLVAVSPKELIYDEVFYIDIAKQLAKSGLTSQFIENMTAPTGILYGIVHLIPSGLTGLQPPWIRWVNVIFAGGCCYFLYLISDKLRQTFQQRPANPSISIPAAWLCAPINAIILCLALTEMSGIFFSLAGTYFALDSSLEAEQRRIPVGKLILSGVLFGLSIWGRQNFIIVPVCTLFLFLPLTWKRVCSFLLLLGSSLPFFLGPIIIWKGLVPKTVGFVESGLALNSLFFSLYYLSAVLCIVSPNLYWPIKKSKLVICLALSAATLALMPSLIWSPSQYFIKNLFGATGLMVSGVLFSSIFLALSYFTIFSMIEIALKNPRDKIVHFLLSSSALLLISNVKITHQFSSRYITLALPFALILVYNYTSIPRRPGLGRLVLLLLGLAGGSLFVINQYRKIWAA